MAMLDASKIAISLKKLLGKAQTDNAKESSNEARFSGLTVSASTIFGESIPPSPTTTNLYDITSGRVEFVRLVLDVDPSANGHAFVARLPSDYESTSTNPKKGTAPFINGQVLSSTSGGIQIVPPLYGLGYEGKPYRGGSATKGSGSLVAPGDVVDWNLDYFNGVIFQENDPNTSPANMTYLECLIWVGDFVSDALEGQQSQISDLIGPAVNADVDTGTEVIDTVDTTGHSMVKWIVAARKGSTFVGTEILAARTGSSIDYTQYAELRMGNPANGFCVFSVDLSGDNMQLKATVNTDDVSVNSVRINVV
jgi:hypothetical protein